MSVRFHPSPPKSAPQVAGDMFYDNRFTLKCLDLPVSGNAKYAGIFVINLLIAKR